MIQFTRIGNETEKITTKLTEIKGILREYYEQLYDNKLNLENEKDKASRNA